MAQQFMSLGLGGDYRIMQESAAGQEGEILASQDTATADLDLSRTSASRTFGAQNS